MKNDAKVALTVIGVSFCILVGKIFFDVFSDTAKAERAKEAQQRINEMEPHIIAEKDGCKVYAFRPHQNARMKHFVNCENSAHTSTDN